MTRIELVEDNAGQLFLIDRERGRVWSGLESIREPTPLEDIARLADGETDDWQGLDSYPLSEGDPSDHVETRRLATYDGTNLTIHLRDKTSHMAIPGGAGQHYLQVQIQD